MFDIQREIDKATGEVLGMSSADYHADPADVPSLSSHIAHILVTKSPLHAWTAHPRLNPNYRPEEKEAFDLGSAAHALLLEGEDRMVLIDAPDYRTKAAQEARDAARQAGRYPVLVRQQRSVQAMVAVAQEAIARCSDLSGVTLADGEAEHTLQWREGETRCRARLDWIAKSRDLIIDYKTTAASASPDDWARSMVNMGADLQAAFYLRGNAQTGGPEDAKFLFLVQENYAPFACSILGLPPSFVALGESKARQAVEEWAQCMKSGQWPSYPSRICWIEPPAWEQVRWGDKQAERGFPYSVEQLWEKIPK